MNTQNFRSLQEAYLGVYVNEGVAGDVANRAQKLANQRKGQTPKRKEMYQSLADKASERERKPFKWENTLRKGLTKAEREQRRDDDAYHHDVFSERPGKHQHGEPTYGKGGITKNPKKLARQKAKGEHAEQYDIYDSILSHLLDEGYAETPEAAEVIMVNMSEGWRVGIIEGLGGAKNQGDYEENEDERQRIRDEHLRKYKSGELPFQKQKKAEKAQEFLKKHPKKKK